MSNEQIFSANSDMAQEVSTAESNPGKGYSIACMVVGIVSCAMIFLSGFLWYLILGFVAIYLGALARKKGQMNGFRKAGMICGTIGLVAGIIFGIITIVMAVWASVYAAQAYDAVLDMTKAGKTAIEGLGGVG